MVPRTDGLTSTDRALYTLEVLVNAEAPLTLTELARLSGIPLTTCSAITTALEHRGYAQRTIVGRSHLWSPSLKLYGLGMRTLRRVGIGTEGESVLRQLCDEVQLPSHLGVLDGSSVVYVGKASTAGMVQFNTYLGKRSAFNLTALGKAIVAFLPESQVDELIDQAVPGTGPKAQEASRGHLMAEFADIRAQGYAVEDQEEEEGIACIAAPVLTADGVAVAAIGVTGLEHQLLHGRRPLLVRSVVDAGNHLARKTGLARR